MRDVQEAVGGDYWLHPADRPLLDGAERAGRGVRLSARRRRPAPVHDLADGQRIALGDESLEVIHTPGHSPGGVCVPAAATALWVGDTLFAGSIGRTDLPGGSFEDARALDPRRGSSRSATTSAACPGHGPGPRRSARERRDNPFVGEHARFA